MIQATKYFSLSLLLVWAALSQPLTAVAADPAIEISQGEIEAAKYTIAKPCSWAGKLLLIAHGHRPESAELDASLDIERPVYAGLLADGWMVAITSYRRNGIIIEDALDDLDNLRNHIAQTYGEPSRTLIMGDSMGGAIGTLIAEKRHEAYDGILAVGAALGVREGQNSQRLNHEPRIPVLFLTNQSELKGPAAYFDKASRAAVAPALWQVSRDGHVNVNDAEREAALHALAQWAETGRIVRERDATIHGSFQQSSAGFSDESAYTTITSISAVYGNIFTGFVAADLRRLGLKPGSHFKLIFGDQTVTVLWGINYGDVKQGDWVAFISAEGNLMIARNSENACKTLNCAVGDRVQLYP